MKNAKNEILILPAKALNRPLSELSALPGRITSEVRAVWEEKKGDLEKALKKSKRPSGTKLHFSDGSTLAILALPENPSAFYLQTGIRKTFESILEADASLVIQLEALSESAPELAKRSALALAALSKMAHWKPTSFGKKAEKKKGKDDTPKPIEKAEWRAGQIQKDLPSLIQKGKALGEANNLIRTLAELPSNVLTPATYRKKAQALAQENGVSYSFWSIKDLEKKKAGAFLAVNQADTKSQAGIAVLKYVPKGKKSQPKKKAEQAKVLALVGKGVCFDTGGNNIKISGNMLGMHGDMTGSAVALALCLYFAQMKAPFEVHAYLALSENLISPTAYKPNDVVVASDGTSIEIIDTDAEGRLILADTLALVRKTAPSLCIDYATLTGTALRALDTQRCAVFSNRADLAAMAVNAGEASGERTWSFPLGDEFQDGLKSKVADLAQVGPGKNADHIYAATFLAHFVGEETPWIHVDLSAGENKGGLGLTSSDTTGFGVFFTDELVNQVLG
jgi:leucyl aminopeptidase/proline iminopeptidase